MFCGGRDLLSGLLWQSSFILQPIPLCSTPFRWQGREILYHYQVSDWGSSILKEPKAFFWRKKMSWDGGCLAWSAHMHLLRTTPALGHRVPYPRKPLSPRQASIVGHPNVVCSTPRSLGLHSQSSSWWLRPPDLCTKQNLSPHLRDPFTFLL